MKHAPIGNQKLAVELTENRSQRSMKIGQESLHSPVKTSSSSVM